MASATLLTARDYRVGLALEAQAARDIDGGRTGQAVEL